MASNIKQHISRRVVDHLKKSNLSITSVIDLASRIKIDRAEDNRAVFHLPLESIESCIKKESTARISKHLLNLPSDSIISCVSATEVKGISNVVFNVNRHMFLSTILGDTTAKNPSPFNGMSVVLDFSSPNIAKPFHMGHLRSTVIGNFLSNIYEWVGYKVYRLNYFGDWGLQLGLVQVGMSLLNPSSNEISQNPLSILYKAYVIANQAAEKDPSILNRAQKYFYDLETGKDADMSDWDLYRNYTISELEKTYQRLGVKFSDYAWESNYRACNLQSVLASLQSRGMLSTDEEGRTVGKISNGENVPLLKSDGSTLYLMREIAAAFDRQHKFKFHKMLYVVDTNQTSHFKKLFDILRDLNVPWTENLQHVSFGRVRGMSSRKGEAVFLSDVLDESQRRMMERQSSSPNTRVFGDDGLKVADILGVSAVIVADLRHARRKHYAFNWDEALNVKGDTGVHLQYTHCRLCSLLKKSGKSRANICDTNILTEPIVDILVLEISRFDDIIQESLEKLEAQVLTTYLFTLCNIINRAILELQVKDSESGDQRLLLFEEARCILNCGMTILGLSPLTAM